MLFYISVNALEIRAVQSLKGIVWCVVDCTYKEREGYVLLFLFSTQRGYIRSKWLNQPLYLKTADSCGIFSQGFRYYFVNFSIFIYYVSCGIWDRIKEWHLTLFVHGCRKRRLKDQQNSHMRWTAIEFATSTVVGEFSYHYVKVVKNTCPQTSENAFLPSKLFLHTYTYITLTLYPRRGSRGISDIPPNHSHSTKITSLWGILQTWQVVSPSPSGRSLSQV
jgi:hypothetical protein